MSATIASCGKVLLTHNLENPKPLLSFSPHIGSINSVIWNHNNQVLASCGSDGKIILSHSQKSEILMKFEDDYSPSKSSTLSSLSFSSGSLQLACGTGDGRVKIYDLKNKRLSQTFSNHIGGVTSVNWHQNDVLLASSNQVGEIHLHSLEQEGIVATLKESCGIHQIKFSPFRQQQLASCCNDGKVVVWDINSRSQTCSFSKHVGKASAIAFSPQNQILLCSASIDSKINIYDIHEKKVLKVLPTKAPLTSLAFNNDGHTIVTGTVYGDLWVYDLRAGQEPKYQLQGHTPNSPVSFISVIQPQDKHKSRVAVHPPSQTNILKQSSLIPKPPETQSKQLNESSISVKSRFSDGLPPNPAKQSMVQTEGSQSERESMKQASQQLPLQQQYLNQQTTNLPFSQQAIQQPSPVSQKYLNSANNRNSSSLTPTNKTSQIAPSFNVNSFINHENSNNNNNSTNNISNIANNVNNTPANNLPSSSFLKNSNTSLMSNNNNNSNSNNAPFQIFQGIQNNNNNNNNITNNNQTQKSQFLQHLSSSKISSKAEEDEDSRSKFGMNKNFSNQQLMNTSNNGITSDVPFTTKYSTIIERHQGFVPQEQQQQQSIQSNGDDFTEKQKIAIRNMLEDQSMELKAQFQEQISGLHIELIRQFQIQQNDISNLMENYMTKNAFLEDKIAKLQAENDKLKKSSY